jgi:hypothetical protein
VVVIGTPYTPTPGWGEIWGGFLVLGVLALIFGMNTFGYGRRRFSGPEYRKWVAAQLIGVAIFAPFGVYLIIIGIVHLF